MQLTPNSILWIKNINANSGEGAYFDTGDEFRLHFPNNHQMNAAHPDVGDAILLFQKLEAKHVFTHIVSPVSREVKEEAGRTKYRYYREVAVLAKKLGTPFIYRQNTMFRKIDMRGVSQGNVCRIDRMKRVLEQELFEAIQHEMYAHFLPEVDTSKSKPEDSDESAEEGNRILQMHYAYERNRKLTEKKKAKAIRENKLECEVCRFSFLKKYGQIYVECHHLTPLGKDVIRNTSLEDLSLVCSNCHRMLHRKIDGEYFSIEQLKSQIREIDGAIISSPKNSMNQTPVRE